MALSKDIGPYVSNAQFGSSVLETTTILSNILRPAGYGRDIINDLAIYTFLENERNNIKAPATMHLLGLKKALLYAIPVIDAPSSTIGITLTSQVSSRAIQYDQKRRKATDAAVMVGDKFRLIGLAFPPKLVNHLAFSIFQWKYFDTLPLAYQPSPIDLSYMSEIDTKETKLGNIYLIKPAHYEDATLFDAINRVIARSLNADMSVVMSMTNLQKIQPTVPLGRMDPFNRVKYIKQLNDIAVQQIDATYTMAIYEALYMTTNWLLYDHIDLLGVASPEVTKRLTELAYTKQQKLQMQANLRETTYQSLLTTRAEKLTRERFPYYFDYTDRRSLFVRFNRFAIDKLPRREQAEIKLLLEKDLAAQNALLNNKCEHIKHLRAFRLSTEQVQESYKAIETYINYDSLDADKMYSCKLCSYSLMCAHEVDLYDALQVAESAADSNRDIDSAHWVRQKIINQYKLINLKRTGDEDTDALFTYYCKHCGGELGKSDDVIQATLKTLEGSQSVRSDDPNEATLYMAIVGVIQNHMNAAIMPMSKKVLIKLIYEECRSEIMGYVDKASKNERTNIDIFIRYLATIYTLASLISINIHKLKSASSILVQIKSLKQEEQRQPETVDGGAQLKDELIAALKIVQASTSIRRVGITDDKIKAMLIEAFKFVNRVFADEAISLKATTPKDRLRLDIANSPLVAYATHMYRRDNRWKNDIDLWELTGVSLDKLYPKKRAAEPLPTHALYTNLFKPKAPSSDETDKYRKESYRTLDEFVTLEPTNGKYTSVVTPALSEFAQKHEAAIRKYLNAKRTIPVRYLPVENSREYDFELKVYQIGYCLLEDGTVRPHRWSVTRTATKLVYTCRYCKLDIEKASKGKNDQIEDKLDEQMAMDAFFELYSLSCPIKDAHVFVENVCTQCNATVAQIDSHDPKYYKKYVATYDKYRRAVITDIIKDTTAILSYAKLADKSIGKSKKPTELADGVKLESLANSLAKLYQLNDLHTIGMDSTNTRSINIVESYVRLLYSYYTFAKNISTDTRSHPDPTFLAFVKDNYMTGAKPKAPILAALPAFPESDNANQLLVDLFQIVYTLIDSNKSDTSKLVEFIVKKIAEQDTRRKEFNFAKLRAVNNAADDESQVQNIIADSEIPEEELDMFDGYDIGSDDMEDNLDSFKD
jgi:hypothetical protein